MQLTRYHVIHHGTASHVTNIVSRVTNECKMAEAVLLSPTFPPGGASLMQPLAVMGMPGFDNRVRKSGVRKIVDYHSSVVRYLEVSDLDDTLVSRY